MASSQFRKFFGVLINLTAVIKALAPDCLFNKIFFQFFIEMVKTLAFKTSESNRRKWPVLHPNSSSRVEKIQRYVKVSQIKCINNTHVLFLDEIIISLSLNDVMSLILK